MCVLDLAFPGKARERLAALTSALSQAQELSPRAKIEEIAVARERRAALSAEMQDIERQLEEALRSLGNDAA